MLKKTLTATLLFFLMVPVAGALAQETGTVTGVVTDSTSGDTVPGASVLVVGTQLGASTGPDGSYEIAGVPAGQQTLEVSFVGYRTEEVPVDVTAGETVTADVALASSAVALDDVVVTALGVEQEERSLGYAVTEVGGEELAEVPDANFVNSLKGKVAGANFFQSNSMGGSTRITLRGISSIAGNNQPLFVVDGIPIDNTSLTNGNYDYGNAAQIVNPENIQSVSVLKGGAATALYGSRGSNGVIQITTKDGSGVGDGVGVTISTSLTATDVYGLPDFQNKFGGGYDHPFLTLDGDFVQDGEDDDYIVSYGEDESWGPRLDDGRMVREWFSYDDVNGFEGQETPWNSNPGNVENYFRTGLESNTTVSFSQAGDDFNYRVSLRNLSTRGTYQNASLTRRQVNFNGGVDLTDDLAVDVTANYIDGNAQARVGQAYGGTGPFTQLTHFGHRQLNLSEDGPMRDITRPDGSQRGWNWDTVDGSFPAGAQAGQFRFANNPFWIQRRNFPTDETERLFGKVRASYDFTDNLTLAADLNTDLNNRRLQQRVAVGSQGLSSYSEQIFETQEIQGSTRLTWDGNLTDDLTLTVFGAGAYRYETLSNNFVGTNGGLIAPGVYTVENSLTRPSVTDNLEQQEVYSAYGQAQVGWRDLLYGTVTARNDWSSTLPADNNSYFYPSLQGSFVFSALPALSASDVLSFGKIRASVSQTGSDTEPYRLLNVFPTGTPFNGRPVQNIPGQLNNPNLRPEVKTEYEIGTQLDFFNNRLGLDATYFYNSTTDQILPTDVTNASGYGSTIINAGEVTNEGVELALTSTPVITDRFQWDVNANWSLINNEIQSLGEGLQAYTIGSPAFGPAVQARVGEPYGTFFGAGTVRDANGNLVLDGDTGVPLASEPKVLGSYRPDWRAGASTTLSYGGLSASVSFDGQYGGNIYSLSNLWGMSSGMFTETTDGNVRALGVNPEGVWFPMNYDDNPNNDVDPATNEGVEFDQSVNARTYFGGLFGSTREAIIYDASYVKLREVRLAYTLPQRWLQDLPIRSLTVSAIGSNLFTLTKNVPNIDPSYAIGAGNLQGYEVGQDPPKRSYGGSLRIEL